MGKRRTETCVAPRDVYASRDALLVIFLFLFIICCTRTVSYIYISPINDEQRGGEGVRRQTCSFCSIFPVQHTTSWIGHRVK